jgi:hypothetical protein
MASKFDMLFKTRRERREAVRTGAFSSSLLDLAPFILRMFLCIARMPFPDAVAAHHFTLMAEGTYMYLYCLHICTVCCTVCVRLPCQL